MIGPSEEPIEMTAPSQPRSIDGQPPVANIFESVITNGLAAGSISIREPTPDWGEIRWQTGPIQEVGRNGVLMEELLEWVILPRLRA